MLGGVLQKSTEEGRRRVDTWLEDEIKKNLIQLKQFEQLCAESGEQPATVALAWLLHKPDVTAPIIGPRTVDQLSGAVRAVELKLSADLLSNLDQLWKGPGGEAPEAYAW
jgi:aryl-alcohol dehydrogenase-like predicted oxidoreductase